jgi:hypothetical protein
MFSDGYVVGCVLCVLLCVLCVLLCVLCVCCCVVVALSSAVIEALRYKPEGCGLETR